MTERERRAAAMIAEFQAGFSTDVTLAAARQRAGTFAQNLLRLLETAA